MDLIEYTKQVNCTYVGISHILDKEVAVIQISHVRVILAFIIIEMIIYLIM